MAERTGPLAGVSVLELSDGWSSAAVTGRLLADLGATVHQAELPGGNTLHRTGPRHRGGGTYTAAGLLAGKSVSSAPTDLAALTTWLAEPDVLLIDDTWRAHLTVVGLPVEVLRPMCGDSVVAVLTPFGTDADDIAPARGSELIVQALAGVMDVTGRPEAPPTRAGVPLGISTTALIATGAIAAALTRRAQHGVPAWLDLAEYDAMIMMQGNFLPGLFTTGRVPTRVGNVQPLSAPWNSYPTSDGEVVIIAISENLWQRLLTVIGREDVIGDERLIGKVNRVAHRPEVDGLIADWTRRRTTAEVVDALERARIPVSDVANVADVMADPVLTERKLSAHVEIEGVSVPVWGTIFNGAAGVDCPLLPSHPDGRVRPLAGLRVLEVGGHTAGGMSTRLLGDLGAEVIKVEFPQGDNARDTAPLLGDGYSYLWHFWNVGKKSVVLRLGEDEGRSLLDELVATSDVFVQNMALDTVERLRLLPADLHAVNPALVYAGVTGFGLTGSRRYRRAFDTVVQAAAGIMSVTGDEIGPVKTGPSTVDNSAALAGVAGVLAALYRRATQGPGAVVDIALFDTAVWLTTEWWSQVRAGHEVGPLGNGHPHRVLDGTYRAVDGRWVAVSGTEDDRVRLEELVGPDLPAWVAQRPATEVVTVLSDSGLAAALVHTLDEVVAHPLTVRRSMLTELVLTGPDGAPASESCTIVGTPYKFVGEPAMAATVRRVPRLGEHTASVLGQVAHD